MIMRLIRLNLTGTISTNILIPRKLSPPLSVLTCHSGGGVPLRCNQHLTALNCVNNHLMLIYGTIPTACQHIHSK